MPGTTIGTRLPGPNKVVFTAHISIEQRDGKYSQKWRYDGDESIARKMQKCLEEIVSELNAG
jgi:hypothetical protein